MKTLISNIENQIQHFKNQLPMLSDSDKEFMINKITEYKRGLTILKASTTDLDVEHYVATCNRGVINHKTTIVEFAAKLFEELEEVQNEYEKELMGESNNLLQELTDVKAVINNWMIHFNHDPKVELIVNIEKQRLRSVVPTTKSGGFIKQSIVTGELIEPHIQYKSFYECKGNCQANERPIYIPF